MRACAPRLGKAASWGGAGATLSLSKIFFCGQRLRGRSWCTMPDMYATAAAPCGLDPAQHALSARPLSRGRKRLVLAATVLGSSLAFIDGSVVGVALPAMQQDLGIGAAGAQWIVNAYLLMLGALVLIGGSAADRFGRRAVFVAGVALFTAASVACALAPNGSALIGARAVQGVGAALLTPASLAVLGSCFPADERARAFGAWAGFGALTSALGPVLGGWLTDAVSWRAIFWITLPVAVLAAGLALRFVPESRDETAGRLDAVGAVLAACGLATVTWGLIAGPDRGFADVTVLAALAGGAALLAAFLWSQAVRLDPMMPLSLYRSRAFSGTNLLTLLLYFALSGVLFFLPYQLIRVHGLSATGAGAALAPFAVFMGLFSGLAGRLADRIGPRLPLTIGPVLAGAGIFALSLPPPGTSYWSGVLPAVLLLAAGMTLAVGPLTATVMAAAPSGRAGVASGVNNAVARVGGLLAVAGLGVLFSAAFGWELSGSAEAERAALAEAMGGSGSAGGLAEPLHRAFRVVAAAAGLCAAAGGAAAFLTVPARRTRR